MGNSKIVVIVPQKDKLEIVVKTLDMHSKKITYRILDGLTETLVNLMHEGQSHFSNGELKQYVGQPCAILLYTGNSKNFDISRLKLEEQFFYSQAEEAVHEVYSSILR
jgi:hypothetical protein